MSTPLDGPRSWWTLAVTTFAFTACFAAWMINGVLVTYLVDNGIYAWEPREMGWLIGIPVLTGAVVRLPLGIATDRWGGKPVYTVLLLVASVPMFLLSTCDSYWGFFAASLGFGLVGGGFAVGIAFSSVWFSRHRQGLALGIFGAGNAGAAMTALIAPSVLGWLTDNNANPDGWRTLPRLYAAVLVATAIVFFLGTTNRLAEGAKGRTLAEGLRPLGTVRVWRFGLYYFFVFGGFVALAQWLVPYYVNVYGTTIALAGALTAINTLPSGVIRALGGWMSDRWGARRVMYWVFGISIACCALLLFPQMDIHSPGSGIMARASGVVTAVDADRIVVHSDKLQRDFTYDLEALGAPTVSDEARMSGVLVWPRSKSWHEPAVKLGDQVEKKQLLARGVTHIFFQANIWIFTFLSFLLGSVMGIGKAAVYKHIPEYFPREVGAVGGIVGVIGGLGGFVCPVIFGYLLEGTGLWTTCWLFFLVVVVVCLLWMHTVIKQMYAREAPHVQHSMDDIGLASARAYAGEPVASGHREPI